MSATAPKPPALRLPDDLTELDQWVVWRHEDRGGRRTKVPYQKSGALASSTDPATWISYGDAVAALGAQPGRFAGIGFVFSADDPYTGIDFDQCLRDGKLKPWVSPIIAALGDSYMEVSPSGSGVKVWVKATLKGTGTKRSYQDGAIEIYDRGRFFTVTGQALNDAPLHVEEHQRDVDDLYRLLTGVETAKPKADIAAREVVGEGRRHEYLNSVAAQFGAKGMGIEEIFAATQAINQSRCRPPKSEKEVRDICEWVINRERTKGRVVSMPRTGAPSGEERDNTSANAAQSVGECSFFASLSPYPAPITEAGYYGIAGEFVRMVEGHTEADPCFLLVSFLVAAGNMFGRNAFIWAGGDRHHSNLFACGVGPTSSGRKGSAYGPIDMFFAGMDEDWAKSVQSGLSSGEGLIWCVRDAIVKREKVSKKGQAERYEDVLADDGVKDKRLLVRQSEFFGALQVMKRQGNTLSPTLRDAWDRGDLKTMVKNSPARATGAHISIIANITKEELLRGMLAEEMDNGFANRFLWVCSRRSKCLPEGGQLYNVDFSELWKRFGLAWHANQKFLAMTRDAEAGDIWGRDSGGESGLYRQLTRDKHGMFGSCTARGAANVLRLSLVYALLDGSEQIRREHLDAAAEVWRYCEDSAKYIFGDALGDPVADEILSALRNTQQGLTRKEIADLSARHWSRTIIDRGLFVLHESGLARFEKQPTNGRPIERWFAVLAK